MLSFQEGTDTSNNSIHFLNHTSLITDLLNILNDSELPLPKRLKIANKTYKSHDLPLQRKEALLLKWLLEQPNDLSSWKLLFSWLSDDTFKHLNRNELKTDDILAIVQV